MASSSFKNDAVPPLTLFARSTMSLLRCWPALRLVLNESSSDSNEVERHVQTLATEILSLFLENAPSSSEPPQQPFTPSGPGSTSNSNVSASPPAEQSDIEALLISYMSDELSTSLEDDSEVIIARDLGSLWTESYDPSEVSHPVMERVKQMEQKLKGKKWTADVREESEEVDGDDDDDDDDDDDGDDWSDEEEDGDAMDVDAPTPSAIETRQRRREEPIVDEEGFTLVKKKR